jgi:hypothetical protein
MAVSNGWDRAVSFADDFVKRLADVHGLDSIGGETSAAAIVAKRSAFTGLHPEGFVSAGGSCRFLSAAGLAGDRSGFGIVRCPVG